MDTYRTKLFRDKVELIPLTSCHVWTGAVDSAGYGRFSVAKRKLDGAHRVAYMLSKGPIPAGMMVLHSCDFKLCVNSDHLFLGNARDNALDCVRKGGLRHARAKGIYNGRAKLTEAQILDIRSLYATGNYSQSEIATRFNVDQTVISDIVRRVCWKHI